jgi:deoxyribodipyrimidine photo-lyase
VPQPLRDMTAASALFWFKRDLRVRDHAALAEAMHFENALGLVVIEPQWLESPECDPRPTLIAPACGLVPAQRDHLPSR